MGNVVGDERGDKEIAVVIAGVQAQRQRMLGGLAGGLQQFRLELVGQEVVVLALVHQDVQLFLGLRNQRTGIVLFPGFFVGADVVAERLFAPGAVDRRADRRKRGNGLVD